ncbi:MAG: hypothetical protein ACLR06_13995 [Christensenellaceae bacterium]
MGQEIQRRADGGISVAAVAGDPFKAVGVMGIFYEKAFPVAKTALKGRGLKALPKRERKKGLLRATGGQNCEFSGARLSAGMGFSEYLTEGESIRISTIPTIRLGRLRFCHIPTGTERGKRH